MTDQKKTNSGLRPETSQHVAMVVPMGRGRFAAGELRAIHNPAPDPHPKVPDRPPTYVSDSYKKYRPDALDRAEDEPAVEPAPSEADEMKSEEEVALAASASEGEEGASAESPPADPAG